MWGQPYCPRDSVMSFRSSSLAIAAAALTGLLLVAGLALAHDGPKRNHLEGQGGTWTRVVHDCADDYGWHGGPQDTQNAGHGLVNLDVKETTHDGTPVVSFYLLMDTRNPDTGTGDPREGDRPIWETLTFSSPGKDVQLTFNSTDGDYTSAYRIEDANVDPIDPHVRYPTQDEDVVGDETGRFALIWNLTYEDLQVEDGEDLTGWKVVGGYEDTVTGEPKEGDKLVGGYWDPSTRDYEPVCENDDGSYDSSDSDVVPPRPFTVENSTWPTPPTADPTWTPQDPVAGETISFRANATDPDGEVTSVSWDLGDGATATDPELEHTYEEAGNYTVTVTVEDDDGATATVDETIAVAEPPNEPPVADATVTPQNPTAGEEATLEAGASDPDGQVAGVRWSFEDGTTADGATVTRTWDEPGNYTVTVTVEDDEGATTSADLPVEVRAPDRNSPPTARFSWTPGRPAVGETVTFADESEDPDGSLASWTWRTGDGARLTGPNPDHVYEDPGEYTVRLTVEDDDGATANRTQTLTVPSAPDDDGEDPDSTDNGTGDGQADSNDSTTGEPDGTDGSLEQTTGNRDDTDDASGGGDGAGDGADGDSAGTSGANGTPGPGFAATLTAGLLAGAAARLPRS